MVDIYNQRSEGITAFTDRINYYEEGRNKFIRNCGTHVAKYRVILSLEAPNYCL